MAHLLESAVRGRCNVLVSGAAGAGKTALLNALCRCIPAEERLVSVESTPELRLEHPHAVRMATQCAGSDGQGEISARVLVRNAQRMRPDRILVGEIRDAEALEVLQAMNAGHEGSMATLHASTPADALARLELLVGLAGFQGAPRTLRQLVASAVDLVVQVDRLAGGRRWVTAIREITGVVDDQYQVQDLFRYDADDDHFAREAFQPVCPRLRRALKQPRGRSGLSSLPHA
jgi:pilus assembly protein CpaF